MNVNRCELSGRVTRDGELKSTTGGTAVLTFGLAFNDRKRNAAGTWEDVPNFIDCVLYGKAAEGLAQYIEKGRHVFVAGKLKYSSWEKGGQRRSKIELIIDTIDLASGSNGGKQQQTQQAQPTYATPQEYEQPDLYDEDIPF